MKLSALRSRLTAPLALALFLTGTNWCALAAVPGLVRAARLPACDRIAAATASPRSAARCSHCCGSTSAARRPAAPQPAKARGTMPCCLAFAPVVGASADGLAPKLVAAGFVALFAPVPASGDPDVATIRLRPPARSERSPAALHASPLAGRAPPSA